MIYRFIILAVITSLAIPIGGCSTETIEDPQPDPLQVQLNALQNGGASWSTVGGSVSKDGFDVSSQFTGFTVNFGEFTYTTQNSVDTAWSGSGTWQFSNNNPNLILRDDGVLIDVNLNGNTLVLRFTVDGTAGGRVAGIAGEFIFALSGN